MAGPRDKNNSEASAAGGWQGSDKPRPKTLGGRLLQPLTDAPDRPWYDDQETWDSLTEAERETIKRLEKEAPANRSKSRLSEALKAASDMLPSFKKSAPRSADTTPSKGWNTFMDEQDAKRKADPSLPQNPTAPGPAPISDGEKQADALLAVKKAKTIEEKWKALKEARKGQ